MEDKSPQDVLNLLDLEVVEVEVQELFKDKNHKKIKPHKPHHQEDQLLEYQGSMNSQPSMPPQTHKE